MRFVNLTSRSVFSSFAGNISPGAISSEGGKSRRRLEEALEEVVKACGDKLGIRLNEREADLLNRLITLDEKGSNFDPSTIPDEIRNDPTGAARAEKRAFDAQMAEMERNAQANADGMKREAEINGEILIRKPSGPAAMEGSKVALEDLKSGLEKIMEENARIAAKGKPKMDVREALDPIGAHAVKTSGSSAAEELPEDADANEAVTKPRQAKDEDGDVARTADADEPEAEAQDPRNAMDRQAAEVAKGLSVLSVIDNPPSKTKPKGRQKKSK